MREISKCYICEPSYHCVGQGEKKRYYFPMIKEYVESPESIADCPLLREKIVLEPVEKEVHKSTEEQPKLINQNTGEPYDSL